ncbi:helix-turn-helix domain-containing protein [Streptomyces rugosispiralis]|uniref:Helix-turn-helix domain-containing protein n=1 Tax=Streptomyces rugosispiralis TaxID=2967341 RepID=A0ABT1V738_9ACTN|nr:helix-turn-helix transcriptional regulator [Streptomyces rugosispiralis]MCQ8192585.1 helix-turn-helix domain-containing protein [Streptomyces rugosispiralis]
MADPTDEDAGDGAVDLFRALGRQIKVLRERAGLTQKELGERLGYAEATISAAERGLRIPQPELLEAADDLLDAGGVLKAAKEDVERAKAKARVRHPTWFRDYARLEAEAVELCHFANQAVPGLFQTESYTRAVFISRQPLFEDETIEMRVAARLARQTILAQWPLPTVSAVIQEAVLRHPFGGRTVQRGQLEHLLDLARMRNVEVQIMPMDSEEHAGMGGPFTLLTPKGRPQVAYLEVQHISRLITEPEEVRVLAAKYGSIRSQALTPRGSMLLLEKLLGEI